VPEIKYILKTIDPESLIVADSLDNKQKELVDSFEVNTFFNPTTDRARIDIFNLDDELLISNDFYRGYSIIGAGGTAGKDGSSEISVDPIQDAINNGFETGDIKIVYRFSKDIYSSENIRRFFFIKDISPDRTELRLLTTELTDTEILSATNIFSTKLNSIPDFTDFFIQVEDAGNFQAINIATETVNEGTSVVVKLLKPLPINIELESRLTVEETISDAQGFEITTEYIETILGAKPLRGANFDIELKDSNYNPTEYFNYNDLFSYPVTGSNYELYSLFDKKSVNIDVDHSDYSSFIHFSSAEERLKNFEYKLDLIQSYENSIEVINSTGYVENSPSSSVDYYQNLIKGILRNFDHYDKYLYYESSSYAWPKSNTSRPFLNYESTHPSASSWYSNQLVVANSYDNTNQDNLEGSVPTFIREDSNNEPYLLFLNMIGQHFDNLWIYFKAVSDKYDADNRLNFGLSKDLVRDSIESFGINLYSSNNNIDNLLSMFVGETYNSGSEQIDTVYTILSGSLNSTLQPASRDNYQKEVYKRIYHNLPLLVKGKGTSRGLRALISCFGIPENILQVRQYGGINRNKSIYTGPFGYSTGSYDKIRTDNTGSIPPGSTLSNLTKITQQDNKYSDDLHSIQVGFDYSDFVNNILVANVTGSFNVDNYIGDPRDLEESRYHNLDKLLQSLTENTEAVESWDQILFEWQDTEYLWNKYYKDPKGFVRLIKFFDNSLFRIVRDFVPARSNVDVGVIIKPNIFNRSKAKQVQASATEEIYSGSTTTYIVTGSDGGSFTRGSQTSYTEISITPEGTAPVKSHAQEEAKLDGIFSGSLVVASTVDWNKANTIKQAEKNQILFDITSYFASLPLCDIIASAEYLGDIFIISSSDSTKGTVETIYPTSTSPSSTGYVQVHNFDDFEYFTVQATTTFYGATFNGWYTGSGGIIDLSGTIATSSTLTVDPFTEQLYGNEFYARFT